MKLIKVIVAFVTWVELCMFTAIIYIYIYTALLVHITILLATYYYSVV